MLNGDSTLNFLDKAIKVVCMYRERSGTETFYKNIRSIATSLVAWRTKSEIR